jgi:hypothetical protein
MNGPLGICFHKFSPDLTEKDEVLTEKDFEYILRLLKKLLNRV